MLWMLMLAATMQQPDCSSEAIGTAARAACEAGEAYEPSAPPSAPAIPPAPELPPAVAAQMSAFTDCAFDRAAEMNPALETSTADIATAAFDLCDTRLQYETAFIAPLEGDGRSHDEAHVLFEQFRTMLIRQISAVLLKRRIEVLHPLTKP